MKGTLSGLFLMLFLPCFAHEYHFRPLPADYGADVQQIYSIFQSSDGIIWLGTDRGLYVYDGRRYKYISREDNITNKVTAIAESPEGKIWSGYEDGYILIADYQGYKKSIRIDSFSGTAISKLVFTAPDQVCITTYGKGIWKWTPADIHHLKLPGIEHVLDIYDALLDKKGNVWLATDDGIKIYTELAEPHIRSVNRQLGLRDDIITQLTLEETGDVLIGLYDMGVQRHIMHAWTIENVMLTQPEEGTVISVSNGHAGDIWMATSKHVWLKSKNASAHKIGLPFEAKNRINDFLYDMDGNLWIVTGNRIFIANSRIEYIHPPLKGIQAILPMGEILWYGCESGLFSTDRHGENLQRHLVHEKINVLSLYRDQHGLLWIGTFGQGLYIFDPVSKRFRHLTDLDKLSNTSILNIDGLDRKIWLATLGGITEIQWQDHPFDGSLTITDLHDRFQFPPEYVYDVYVSKQGRVWFGTDGKGLYYLENDRLFPVPLEITGLDSTPVRIRTIYSIAEDKHNKLWLSSSKGTVLRTEQDGAVISQYASPQGLLNSLVVDGHGEVLMIREGEIYSVLTASRLYGFDETSGAMSFTPNINATALDKDGSVWIADADLVLHYFSLPADQSRALLLNFESISPGDWSTTHTLELKPDSNFLDIRFTGIWYQDPAAIQYRYRLEGHDIEWIYTRERRAVYSRLSPGKYTFVVQASRSEDFTHAAVLQKEILVHPPFYQRWWFLTGFFLVVAGGIFWFIRSRIKRINTMHVLEKEKTMLQLHAIQAQVNPHFLFNSFNTLSSIIEEDQKTAVEYVDQLSAFFRGALMHREGELIPLAQEMDIVRNYAYILKKRYGENISIIEKVDNTSGLIAPLSIQLLVENAIKHNTVSNDRHLVITISIDAQWVVVQNPIQPKFQAGVESTGFGLSSLLARYAYLTPRKIEISTEDNMFTVQIPVIYPEKTS